MNDREKETNRLIGRRLRQARSLRGLTQTAVGHELGVSFQQIQKYENGLNSVSPGKLEALAKMLGLTVPYFFAAPDPVQLGLERDDRTMLSLVRRLCQLKETQPEVFHAICNVLAALPKSE